MENNKSNIIDMVTDETKRDKYKVMGNKIKDIAIEHSLAQLEDPKTLLLAGGVGLYQGLKYKGSFKLGLKAGVSTLGVMIGVNVLNGIIANIDDIKNS